MNIDVILYSLFFLSMWIVTMISFKITCNKYSEKTHTIRVKIIYYIRNAKCSSVIVDIGHKEYEIFDMNSAYASELENMYGRYVTLEIFIRYDGFILIRPVLVLKRIIVNRYGY